MNRTKEIVRGGSREALKLLGSTALMGVLFAPHAVNHAIETTEIDATIGEFPVTIEYQPGASSLDILNLGNIYLDRTKFDVGVQAQITGLPSLDTGGSINNLISPERLAVYTSLADDPDLTIETIRSELQTATIDNAVDYLKWPAVFGGLALYGFGSVVGSRNTLRRLKGQSEIPLTPGYVTGAVTMALAASATIATQHHDAWADKAPDLSETTRISNLANTPFAEATTDSSRLVTVINQGAAYIKKLNARREQALVSYLDSVRPTLQQQLSALSAPKDDEELIFVVSDFHGGEAGTILAQETVRTLVDKFGNDSLALTLNNGDMIYEPELQRNAISEQGLMHPEGRVVLAPGNHDIDNAITYAEEEGMIVPDGKVEVGGVSIYSRKDPQQSPFLGTPFYPNPDESQQTLGQKAYDETSEDPVDIIALHQPAAIAAVLDVPSLRNYTEGSLLPLTSCDPGTSPYRDVAASLLSAGHWHKNYPIHVVCNSDGSWTVVNIQGTAGGAEASPTINNWSDPSTRPIADISYRIFYRNKTHGSITGYADIVIKPSAEVLPIERTNIGTIDGAPFPVLESTPFEQEEAIKPQKKKEMVMQSN